MTGVVHERHERLASTQDRLRRLAGDGASRGSWVLAGEQSAGRGRGGKVWQSRPGEGLCLSVLVAAPAPTEVGGMPLAVGTKIALALEARFGRTIALKWPNDLYAGPEGGKLAGILCESAPRGGAGAPEEGASAIVGIGMNVRGAPPGAAHLEGWAGRTIAVEEVHAVVLEALVPWATRTPPRLDVELHAALAARDLLRGREVMCERGITGRAAGIRPDGALVVRTPGDRVRRVWSGSVHRLPEGGCPGAVGLGTGRDFAPAD